MSRAEHLAILNTDIPDTAEDVSEAAGAVPV
jgi:hypothetical protein